MKRFLYRNYHFVHPIAHRVIRRFTSAGFLVLGGLIASAVVGVDTRQSLAYQGFTFLLSLLLISVTWSLFFRARFSAERILPKFGTAGETLVYRILLHNHSPNPQKGLCVFEEFEDPRPTLREFLEIPEPGEDQRNLFDQAFGVYRWRWLVSRKQGPDVKEHPLPAILPHGKAEVRVEIVPHHRGYLRYTRVTIARPDPLGLFYSFVTVPAPQSLLILPKRYPLPLIHLPGTRQYQSGGVALSSSVGDSEEFISLRDYRAGDSLRKIHWKTWAKTGKPVVKEYQDEFFVRHALILDTFQETEHFELFEEAVSVAASFVCTVQTQESLLDLIFAGPEAYCFTSGRGLAHTDKLLEILASVSISRDKPFAMLPRMVLSRAAMLSGCVCVLLSWDEERQQFISQLKRLGLPVLVLVITDAETGDASALPLDPGPMKDDPKNFHRLELGNIQEGLAKL